MLPPGDAQQVSLWVGTVWMVAVLTPMSLVCVFYEWYLPNECFTWNCISD